MKKISRAKKLYDVTLLFAYRENGIFGGELEQVLLYASSSSEVLAKANTLGIKSSWGIYEPRGKEDFYEFLGVFDLGPAIGPLKHLALAGITTDYTCKSFKQACNEIRKPENFLLRAFEKYGKAVDGMYLADMIFFHKPHHRDRETFSAIAEVVIQAKRRNSVINLAEKAGSSEVLLEKMASIFLPADREDLTYIGLSNLMPIQEKLRSGVTIRTFSRDFRNMSAVRRVLPRNEKILTKGRHIDRDNLRRSRAAAAH